MVIEDEKGAAAASTKNIVYREIFESV